MDAAEALLIIPDYAWDKGYYNIFPRDEEAERKYKQDGMIYFLRVPRYLAGRKMHPERRRSKAEGMGTGTACDWIMVAVVRER